MRFVHYYRAAMGDSGVTVALWGWASAMAAAGYEVLVLHGADVEESRPSLDSFVTARTDPVEHRQIAHSGRGRLLGHPVDIARHLRRGDVLVLHEGWVTRNIVAALSAARAGVPYVLVPHGVYEPSWRRYLRPPQVVRGAIERRVLERATAVHLFFHSESAGLMALAPAARIVVAPTGIEIPDERWRGGGGYLAWVGRYDPTHKGLDILIDAVGMLPPANRPLIRLRGYDYRGGLGRLRRLLGRQPNMDKWIEIGGPISGAEKRRFLLEADGYVLPSRWESHSVALLEVLSLGIPTIVSSALHIAPELRRRDAAVLARPDPRSLAEALVTIKGATYIGARGRALAGTMFAWDGVRADFLRQLETLGFTA